MTDEKDKVLEQLNELIQKPGGRLAARFLLNTLGAVPIVGGAIAGVGAAWGEQDQQKFNEDVISWLNQTDSDLKRVLNILENQLRKPTKAAMSLLIGEVLGIDLMQYGRDISVKTILNGETRAEFAPF